MQSQSVFSEGSTKHSTGNQLGRQLSSQLPVSTLVSIPLHLCDILGTPPPNSRPNRPALLKP